MQEVSFQASPAQEIGQDRRKYLEEVWFTMHHSDNPNTRSLFVRCYLDESGTHDQSSWAVVAGLLMDRDGFLSLDDEWIAHLNKFHLPRPLHMSEFGNPQGPYSKLCYEQKVDLLTGAVSIINRHKKYSIAGVLNKDNYETHVASHVRKGFSQYGFCFVLCAVRNHAILEDVKYRDDIPYILHHGNPRKGDILGAYEACINWQKKRPFHMRTIQFDDGNLLCALQAADMVAWGVRRKLSNLPFENGYEPIIDLFKGKHEQPEWTGKMLREISERFPVEAFDIK
jgi:hypothetical protein